MQPRRILWGTLHVQAMQGGTLIVRGPHLLLWVRGGWRGRRRPLPGDKLYLRTLLLRRRDVHGTKVQSREQDCQAVPCLQRQVDGKQPGHHPLCCQGLLPLRRCRRAKVHSLSELFRRLLLVQLHQEARWDVPTLHQPGTPTRCVHYVPSSSCLVICTYKTGLQARTLPIRLHQGQGLHVRGLQHVCDLRLQQQHIPCRVRALLRLPVQEVLELRGARHQIREASLHQRV